FAAAAVLLVELAVDPGATPVRPVVEFLLDGVLEDLALLLDDEDLAEAVGELARRHRLERPDHAALENADANARAGAFIEPEFIERLAGVEIGLATGHDAEPGARRIDDDVVEAVRPHIGERGIPLVVE